MKNTVMKKILLPLLLLVCSLAGMAQKAQKKFDLAYDLYEKKQYNAALQQFLNVYNKGIGSQEVIYRSYYFAGLIYLNTNNTSEAKKVYKDILSTDIESYEEDTDLWDKPFSIMKHNSCKILAGLALKEKDYKQAFKYLSMADKEYPFIHFCGNAHESNAIFLARMYAKCYVGLGEKEKAIQLLLPYCFSNHYADNSEAADELVVLLKEKYPKSELRKQIAEAREGLYVEQPEKQPWFTQAYVNIFGIKAEVTLSIDGNNKNIVKELKGKALYQYFFDQEKFVKNLLK